MFLSPHLNFFLPRATLPVVEARQWAKKRQVVPVLATEGRSNAQHKRCTRQTCRRPQGFSLGAVQMRRRGNLPLPRDALEPYVSR